MGIVNSTAFLTAYRDVLYHGHKVRPRDQLCLEREDYHLLLDTAESPFTSFKHRNLNVMYAKQELLWYLRANPFDDSIMEHAKMWQKLKQEDGRFYSNYGQYIFSEKWYAKSSQFDFVVQELLNDPDSRRASMVLLQPSHLYHTNTDVVCTYALNFRIRHGKLNMTVMMRSNDLIFGTTNDVFCFWCIYHIVRAKLNASSQSRGYLTPGTYNHIVNSLHIYERHFEMVRLILEDGFTGWYPEHVPVIEPLEINEFLETKGQKAVGPFSTWLNATVR